MAATTWNIDSSHTDVQFSAKHMMVTTVRGKFAGVRGTLHLDEDEPARSRAVLEIPVATVNTGFDARDEHLRSADFFDARTWPTIRFEATALEPKGDDVFAVTGDLTIRDVTRAITLDVEVLGIYRGLSSARRVGFHARTKLAREDWGLGWNVALESGGWLVGKEITLEIDVAAEEVAASGDGREGSAEAAA